MTALSTLAAAASSETSLVRQEHEDVEFAGALAVAIADGHERLRRQARGQRSS
jgi:hypothetical protein